jgi:large subunit ribosomal protein L7Ae
MVSVYELIEKARKTGKVEKGTNEVTKAIERGTAKLVVYGADVSPKEIVQHLPILCKEKNIPCVEADKKEKLGIAVGLGVACASAVIIKAGDSEKDLEGFVKGLKSK